MSMQSELKTVGFMWGKRRTLTNVWSCTMPERSSPPRMIALGYSLKPKHAKRANRQDFLNGNSKGPEAAGKSGWLVGSHATRRREGFERRHVPEKLQFYNVAHASTAEVRSLTYVIEDNYPTMMRDAIDVREKAEQSGRLIGGLIRSTESRKSKLANLLSSLSVLLSSLSLHP